jgi:hypothetical protein
VVAPLTAAKSWAPKSGATTELKTDAIVIGLTSAASMLDYWKEGLFLLVTFLVLAIAWLGV